MMMGVGGKAETVDLASSSGYPVLARVASLLHQKGIAAYLVGGYIRDVLLRRDTADIDVAIPDFDLRTGQRLAAELGGSFVPLDEFNKVARVVLRPEAGNPWSIDFSCLKGTIEQDLAERDFTINSLAADLNPERVLAADVAIIDPLGGRKDLREETVRATGKAIFRSDPARLLRALRFAAELHFTIDETTACLIRDDASLLKTVAAERVRSELVAIFHSPRAYLSVKRMDKLGLLEVIFPELMNCRNVEQPKEHHWDVFTHSVETVAAVERLLTTDQQRPADELLSSVPWTPEIAGYFSRSAGGEVSRGALLKLAALLHDIAKPMTRSRDGDRWRFLGHAKDGAAVVETIMQRLRFSRREINIVVAEVEHHLRPGQLSPWGLPSHRAIYRYFRDTGEVALDTLFLSLADHLASRGPDLDRAAWDENAAAVSYILEHREEMREVVSPPKLIDGHDLITQFHMKPGPEVGRLLEELREAQAAGEVTTREEAVAFVKKSLGFVQGV